MNRQWIVTGVAALVISGQAWGQAVPSQPAAPGGSVAALLQKGIYQEETAGDLAAAAQTYRQVISEGSASRQYVAQALYRLGTVSLKQKQIQPAIEAFGQLKAEYPEQKDLLAKAEREMAETRKGLGEKEVGQIADVAVAKVSTMAESDGRLAPTVATLQGLNDELVVKALVEKLHSQTPEVRRAAIYILWKGPMQDISNAIPELEALTSNEESLTRGMAALVLGGRKAGSALDTLTRMTLEDSSPYARRCAAYALGELGRPEARETLEKAVKDQDEFVRANAKHALAMLGKQTAGSPRINRFSPEVGATDVDPKTPKISITFDQKMRDGSWAWVQRYPDKFPKGDATPSYDSAMTTCSLPVVLEPGHVYWIEFNSPPYIGFHSQTGEPAVHQALVFATRSADGKPTAIPGDLLEQAKALNEEIGKPAPVIVKTEPENLANSVPSSRNSISVTFDRTMANGAWSWVQRYRDKYPTTAGSVSYDSSLRTCSMPVKLEPGKVYWVEFNTPPYLGFRSKGGTPARAHALVFATAGTDGKPTAIPEELKEKAAAINEVRSSSGE